MNYAVVVRISDRLTDLFKGGNQRTAGRRAVREDVGESTAFNELHGKEWPAI